MLKIRRIKTDKFKTAAFWIEKRDNEYIACRTLVNALLGIASPSGKPNIYYNVESEEILYADGKACEKYERRKPEGVAVELADCMIRILDYCGRAGIDIEEAIRIKHEYNKTRPYRHGGKKC